MRIGLAIKSFFAILTTGTLSNELLTQLNLRPAQLPSEEKREIAPTKSKEQEAREREEEAQARAIQLLSLFQRDARLIDFLREDIRPYQDAQVGAAVRSLHESCQQVLDRYIQLEPIISSPEGETVTVPDGFDPANIKLIGNVTGKPPLKGTLRHHGWRASKVELPALPENRLIVAPAEVEIP
ncbi:MAG: DUF2760 domain-containing protein [Acidobacteriota bacterium]